MAIAIRGRIEVLSSQQREIRAQSLSNSWKPINGKSEDGCMRGGEKIEDVRLRLRSA